jgi:hypothetical protein
MSLFAPENNWMAQNYVPKNISIIQNTKLLNPLKFFPSDVTSEGSYGGF